MSTALAPEISRTIVLVGLMGAGKTCIGRRLAPRLGLPFVDVDVEIEAAAGCSIEEIFARRSGREATLHEVDPMDPNSLKKPWKYRSMNLAKMLDINELHDGKSGVVEFRMFDLADPETHRLQAEFYRKMVATAERLAAEGKTVKLDRAVAPEGADPAGAP